MSAERVAAYIDLVVEIAEAGEGTPAERALILASVAQVEATMEILRVVKDQIDVEIPGLIDRLDRLTYLVEKLVERQGM